MAEDLQNPQDLKYMARALELAGQAAAAGEVPVGAVIVKDGEIIAEAANDREAAQSALGHAELQAISIACKKLNNWRLEGCTLYVTLEPCMMCSGACVQSRIDRVVYGATDPKAGAASSLYEILTDDRLNHQCQVTSGVLADESASLLKQFFKELRNGNRNSKT